MRFDVRREERSVEDELGRASPGRNCAGVPEKGGATERESAAGKVMTGRWWWWLMGEGLTRHEVRGQKGNWRKERKMKTRWGGGEAEREGLEEERRVARSHRAGVKVQEMEIL